MPSAQAWRMITLNQPFVWNGVDNILFDTAFDLVVSVHASGQVRMIPTVNGYRFVRSDVESMVDAETTTVENFRPQLRVAFTTIVSEDDIVDVVGATALLGNFPNPFNPETTISFQLSVFCCPFVQIDVYNIRGQRVRTLLDGSREFGAGSHSVVWDGQDDNGERVSSGVYFYRMQAGDYTETRRMLLMK